MAIPFTNATEWGQLDEKARLFIATGGSYVFFLVASIILPIIKPAPKGARRWMWKNRLISWLHALIISVLIIYAAVKEWHIFTGSTAVNLEHQSPLLHFVLSVSIGYFIHDFIDNVLFEFHGSIDNISVLAHHILVVIMFGLFNWIDRYQSFVILTLPTEINSVFLHTRKLLQTSGVTIDKPVYIVNNVLNVATFFFCRVIGQLYMIYSVIMTAYTAPTSLIISGVLAMAGLALVNIALANALFVSDVRQWRKMQKVYQAAKKADRKDNAGKKSVSNGQNGHAHSD